MSESTAVQPAVMTERERFEAWFRAEYESRLYCENRWDGWQAAIASRQGERELMKSGNGTLREPFKLNPPPIYDKHYAATQESEAEQCDKHYATKLLTNAEVQRELMERALEALEVARRAAYASWGESTAEEDALIADLRAALSPEATKGAAIRSSEEGERT